MHVEVPEVHAKMQGTILLPDQNNCIAPWGLAWVNHSCFQHISEGGTYLLQKGWRYTPEPLLERLAVLDANLMLDGTSTPQFIALQCKHIMTGQD